MCGTSLMVGVKKMYSRYRSSNSWKSDYKGCEVIARVIDFRDKRYYDIRPMEIYEYYPHEHSGYDVVLPLVDIYFNGMLLKAGVYYYQCYGWLSEGDSPVVELA